MHPFKSFQQIPPLTSKDLKAKKDKSEAMDPSSDFQSFQQLPPFTSKDLKAKKDKSEAIAKRDQKMMQDRQFDAAEKLVAATKAKDAADKVDSEMDLRVDVLRKIRSYLKAFPDNLKDFKLTPSAESKMSLQDLKAHLKDIEYHLGKRGGAQVLAEGFREGIRNLEGLNNWIGNPFDLNLRNLDKAADAHMKDQFDPLFQEIVCKYENLFSVGVEARFALAVMQLVISVNRVNKIDDALRQPLNRKTPEDLNERINKI